MQCPPKISIHSWKQNIVISKVYPIAAVEKRFHPGRDRFEKLRQHVLLNL